MKKKELRIVRIAMSEQPAWLRDEFQQINTDFSDASVVLRYEERMGEFRDLGTEDAAILHLLGLPRGSHILEIGTGTGHFALAAARDRYRVTALDISTAMLQHARGIARTEGLAGIEFRNEGFLTFASASSEFDAAVSVAALHHLPDLWKAVALSNIHRALKPGGQFVLCDVVFRSTERDLRPQFDAFVRAMPESMRSGTIGHIAKEYSTLDWIIEGLLTRAGFAICQIDHCRAPLVQYLCRAEQL